jgi:hypothetical protein
MEMGREAVLGAGERIHEVRAAARRKKVETSM